MICTNKRCGHDIKAPLELYTGDLACPRCRSRIDLGLEEIKVTARNRELFELSEMWFSYGLARDIDLKIPEAVEAIRIDPHQMIKKATGLATEASLLGHPEARWRVGYYFDRDFVEKDKTESARCKIAAKYYESVFMSPDAEFEGYGQAETERLKRRAALDYLSMVDALPPSEREYYKRGTERASALIPGGYLGSGQDGADKSDAETVKDVIDLFDHNVRAPIFGLITVSRDRLDEVGAIISASCVKMRGEVSFQFIPLDRNGMMHAEFEFSRFFIANLGQYIEKAKKLAEREVSIFFFNKLGKHKYLKNRKKELMEYVESPYDPTSIDLMQKLVGRLAKDRVTIFYDDDIAFYNAAKPKAAYKELVKSLTEGE